MKSSDLPSEVVSLGLLIGLLNEDNNCNITVNTDWFSNPVTQLEDAETRLNNLVALVSSVLGPAGDNPRRRRRSRGPG